MKTRSSLKSASVFLAALILTMASGFSPARGAEPTEPPVFSDPLNIQNLYHPFQPGGVKVFTGSDKGNRVVVVDNYLTDTRAFTLNGETVMCRVLRELAFEGEELVEIADNYFAEADDGTLYYFGEVVDNYENGVIANHDGSWLVGGRTLPTDPADTATATVPAVFMPANPELGDIFKPEDLFPFVDETAEVVATGVTLRVPAGRFKNAIVLKETTRLSPAVERKTYAPGVGVILVRGKTELLRLVASTFPRPQ